MPKEDQRWHRECLEACTRQDGNDLRGVPKNETKSVEWYTKAADRGDAAAQARLGLCLFYGVGGEGAAQGHTFTDCTSLSTLDVYATRRSTEVVKIMNRAKPVTFESLSGDALDALMRRLDCYWSYRRMHLVCKATSHVVSKAGYVGIVYVRGTVNYETISMAELQSRDWVVLKERYKYIGAKIHSSSNGESNEPLDQLPEMLTHLFVTGFDQPLNKLPEGLTRLSVVTFNQPVHNLPAGLTTLDIWSDEFNHPVNKLPAGLKKFRLDTPKFNRPLDKLPTGLTALTILSDEFNNDVDKLPAGLKELRLYAPNFNKPLDKLPAGLTFLDFRSEEFNHPLDKLPAGLTFCCVVIE